MHGKVKAYTRDVHFAIERTTAARLVRQSVVYVARLSIMLLCIDVIRLISRPAVAVPAIEIRRAATRHKPLMSCAIANSILLSI